jgi:hypothetical protein
VSCISYFTCGITVAVEAPVLWLFPVVVGETVLTVWTVRVICTFYTMTSSTWKWRNFWRAFQKTPQRFIDGYNTIQSGVKQVTITQVALIEDMIVLTDRLFSNLFVVMTFNALSLRVTRPCSAFLYRASPASETRGLCLTSLTNQRPVDHSRFHHCLNSHTSMNFTLPMKWINIDVCILSLTCTFELYLIEVTFVTQTVTVTSWKGTNL